MKKYILILIGIAFGWLLSFSSCTNPLRANNNESTTVGKYAVAITGPGDVYCIIIDTETGEVVGKKHFAIQEFEND